MYRILLEYWFIEYRYGYRILTNYGLSVNRQPIHRSGLPISVIDIKTCIVLILIMRQYNVINKVHTIIGSIELSKQISYSTQVTYSINWFQKRRKICNEAIPILNWVQKINLCSNAKLQVLDWNSWIILKFDNRKRKLHKFSRVLDLSLEMCSLVGSQNTFPSQQQQKYRIMCSYKNQ